jgi:hypothetical protein
VRERIDPLPSGVAPDDARAFTTLLNKFEKLLLDGPDAVDEVDWPEGEEPEDEDVVTTAPEDDEAAEEAPEEQERRRAISAVVRQLRAAAKTTEVTRKHWEGGGGFRLLDVAPSMFEEMDGTVIVADWASNGKLAEATAAQLGFIYEPGSPFVGRKGKTRLAVVDGLVNPDVARLLVDALAEDELLTLCGTAVDPTAAAALRELRRGSVVRKIPASILAEYRRPRWQVTSPQATKKGPS